MWVLLSMQLNSKSSKQISNGKGATISIKAHLSTASKSSECGGEHLLHTCEQFKSKTVKQRWKLVREKQLCYNCVSSTHRSQQCPIKHLRQHSKKKHHTLVHNNDFQSNKKNNEQTSLMLPSGNVAPKLQNFQAPTPTRNELVSKVSTASTSVDTHHALEQQISPSFVLLATVWIRLEAPNGRSFKVQTLLDQGSQSSFIVLLILKV